MRKAHEHSAAHVAGSRSRGDSPHLFVFSIGMTALLVDVGLFRGKLAALPRAGRWTRWIERAAGVLLLLVAYTTSSGWAVFYE